MKILGELSWMAWSGNVIDALFLLGGGVWIAILQPGKIEEKIAASPNITFEEARKLRAKYENHRVRGAILMAIGGVRLIYRLFFQ
jgi:hypothetical protein